MKFRLNSRIIKKFVLWTLLLLLGTFFIISIVRSYGSGHILSQSDALQDVVALGEYGQYVKDNEEKLAGKDKYPQGVSIDIGALDYHEKTAGFAKDTIEDYPALLTGEQGEVTYKVDIPYDGFYTINLTYYTKADGGSNVERGFKIDGEYPFDSLRHVVFQRVYGDASEIRTDMMGNHMKPIQEEKEEIKTGFVRDQLGFVPEPYELFFEEGENDLTIVSRREEMYLIKVTISSVEKIKTYDEVKQEYAEKGYKEVTNYYEQIEGEDSSKRSSATLYAINDQTSAYNTPIHHVKTRLNAIGGAKWSVPGDWIGWDIEVPEDGLYQISMRAKQNVNRGMFTPRRLHINGELPFAEAANTKFFYSSKWNVVTLGSAEEPYLFYLTKGKHFISLEATLGDYGYSINQVQEVIDDLNRIYRNIIQKTTVNPDPSVEYYLKDHIPDLEETFVRSAKTLRDVAASLTEISGEKSDKTAVLERMALQLEDFIRNHRNIQKRLSDFNNNISALGTWLIEVREQSVTIDWISVHSSDYKLPKANPNFFNSLWFGLKAFVGSFFFDYQSVGTMKLDENAPQIEVWFLTSATAGREQANAMRSLIDEYFTTMDHNIQVDLKLVRPENLLPATQANRGPDIAINVPDNLPVNYALRNAVMDISDFADFEEVTKRFQESAMVPYWLEGGAYALPNTHSFPVIFYRADIFEEHNWDIPNTWDEVKHFVPELQRNNLEFYLPVNTILGNSVVNPIFASIFYQKDGTFYRNNNKESNFDSPEALEAFEFWTDFYTSYKFPLAANFLNRFRSGEMPIGIAGYEAYNTLQVFAPEIRGKWNMALIPGTEYVDENGEKYIDRRVGSSGTALVMMRNTKMKNEAWEFMKWWTSEDIQVGYARELESVLGPAARHNTANVAALRKLAWTVEESSILLKQWELTVGVPEVAGGYYTGRNLENAFREVINKNENPREILQEYVVRINREITKKRAELKLDEKRGGNN